MKILLFINHDGNRETGQGSFPCWGSLALRVVFQFDDQRQAVVQDNFVSYDLAVRFALSLAYDPCRLADTDPPTFVIFLDGEKVELMIRVPR